MGVSYAMCEWCIEPDSDNDEPDTERLCRPHLAEYLGLSEDELDRIAGEMMKDKEEN